MSSDTGVEDINRELQGATLGGHALVAVLPKLRRLLEAPKAAAFRPVRTQRGFTTEFLFLDGFPAGADKLVIEWLAKAPADAFAYDPSHPAPDQRNVVRRSRAWLPAETVAALPMVRDLFPKVGLAGCDQIRVLVCAGEELLAWVGAFRERSFTDEDERRFSQILPSLQSRLALEASVGRM